MKRIWMLSSFNSVKINICLKLLGDRNGEIGWPKEQEHWESYLKTYRRYGLQLKELCICIVDSPNITRNFIKKKLGKDDISWKIGNWHMLENWQVENARHKLILFYNDRKEIITSRIDKSRNNSIKISFIRNLMNKLN